ncbi:hypothetical protein DUI87_28660 [Hirundo rustica rustica]|uniref:Uncharacterized protein n=1 Tax=Hirundo rustica rustica TaxID=333673 RepID=A0A3M0JJ83_HIRRU|nr:hypothetical protein DUI87_28660 [Hirundo rustica rustica]
MNLLLVGQSMEEQGQWWLGEAVGKGLQNQDTGNVLTLLGGKVSWDVGMDLFRGRVVGPRAGVGRKAASGLERLEVCMAWLEGIGGLKSCRGVVWHGMEQCNVAIAVWLSL